MTRSFGLKASIALSLSLALTGCGADGTPLRPGSAAPADALPARTMTLEDT